MPIPKPKEGETQKTFMGRCMADPTMVKEFPDIEQRAGVCFTTWRSKGDKMEDLKIDKDEIRTDAIKINNKGKSHANALISNGKINESGSWGFDANDGDKLLGPDGDNWAEYSKWFLAINPDVESETKAYYKFPFGKDGQVYRRVILAEKTRAAQQGYDDIVNLADDLLKKIDKKLGKNSKLNDSLINRVDFIEITLPDEDNMDYLTESFKMTDEGFLRGRAVVTNIGVFPYLMEDGSIRWELRPPTEVLNIDSVMSLKGKVLTNDHPGDGVVNIDNVNDLQVGFLGDDIRTDPYHLSIPITITDKETIDDAKNGKRALSCGYFASYVESPGVWMGVPYDGIQKNIRYNHVSIVDRGRAGDSARMRFDSAKARFNSADRSVAISADIQKSKNNIMEDSMNLKTIKLDGVEYQAEGEVIKALNQRRDELDKTVKEIEELKSQLETARSDSAKIEAERDNLKDKVGKLEAEKEEKLDEKAINELVQKRMNILAGAKLADVEVNQDMTDREIKEAVIKKAFPNTNLEGKADEYIDGRFDGAIELLQETQEQANEAESRQLAGDIDTAEKIDCSEARQKMIDRQYKLSRGIKE